MKESLRTLASLASVYSGLTALGRRFGNRDGAIILYGHRVSDDHEGYLAGLKPEWLDAQLAYLGKHYRFLALSELVGYLERGEKVPERSVVITFDDGFRDNYTHAFPLFKKHQVPATIFLTTGCLDSGQLPWSQRLGCLFQQTTVPSLTHSLTHNLPLPLQSPQERKSAYNTVKDPIKKMGRTERETVLTELEGLWETQAPVDRMMTWDMAREMTAAGMEMGAHTVTHPLLANLPEDEAREEMLNSKERLREELGFERPAFCFPAGSRTPQLIELAKTLGFRSVFDSNRQTRINKFPAVDSFHLSRLGLPEASAIHLEAELDGVFHCIRTLFNS